MNKEQAKSKIDEKIFRISCRSVSLADCESKRFELLVKSKWCRLTDGEQELLKAVEKLAPAYRKEIEGYREEIHTYIDQIKWWKLF